MEIHRSRCFGAITALVLFLGSACAHADAPTADRVQLRAGQLLVFQEGKSTPMRGEIALPDGVLVKTNATFTVKGGKVRYLREGQSLSRDGTLLGSDGTSTPIVDHVTLKSGKAVLVKDGERQGLSAAIVLGNGTRVSPDGGVAFPNGTKTRLLDGQLLKLEGEPLPVRDTITLRNGKVIVQKDGSVLTLGQNQSLMMSDGTKVLGNGTVLEKSGQKIQLSEGQVVIVEGVARRPR